MHFCYERAPICGANKSGVWLLWSINILCLIAYAPDCQSCILASSHLSWINIGLSFNIHTLQEHQKAPCTRGHSYQYQRTENSYLYQRTKYTSNNGPTIYTSSTRGQKQPPVPEEKASYQYQRTEDTATCTRGRDKPSPPSVPAPADRATEPWILLTGIIMMLLLMIVVISFMMTRSLGALRAPTSRLRPFGPVW